MKNIMMAMLPGICRMPSVFTDGKSLLTTVLDGRPDSQADAMWAYLSLGPGLPLPAGLEPRRGLIVSVTDRPKVLRTFMPDAGSRALAIGFPNGVSVAFDFAARGSKGASVASLDAAKRKAAVLEARALVEKHPLVQKALAIFDAELKDIRLPAQEE